MAKPLAAKCPTCGANLPVVPGALQVTCRYCQNVITVQVQKAPPNVTPFGMPGGMPSRTLYVDPAAMAAAQRAGKISLGVFLVIFALPFIIGIGAAVGPCAMRSCKGAIRPFPISCGVNEEVQVSGTWEGKGPIVASAGVNCKIRIKDSKLKAPVFIDSSATNLEVTFENVQIETTETMFRGPTNVKLRAKGSTFVAQGDVFDLDSSADFTLEDTTVESKTGYAIKTKPNYKLRATASKIRGKKGAVDTSSSFKLELQKGCELTSADGPAVRATSGMQARIDGGKIDGAGGAFVTQSSFELNGTGVTIASAKDRAIATTSSFKLELTDSTVTSGGDAAIVCDSSSDITLANTTVQGTAGIEGSSGVKLKATKKSRVVATTGIGFAGTSGLEVNLSEASIEGGTKAIKGTSNVRVKLAPGSRVAAKMGAIETESSCNVDANGASIEGGAGAGILTTSSPNIAVRSGVLKGNPALQTSFAYTPDLTGTRVEGAQVVKR
ncbi:MAG: hypothetical protein KIT84_31580 [Labilithrix sp.]|nr:hypothetical protein [Labilithrix sp.]MCW5815611.1 hypothetical protein [Labilithrix sp.]